MRKIFAGALLALAFLIAGCADTDYPVEWRDERAEWWDTMSAAEQREACSNYFGLDNATAEPVPGEVLKLP